VEGDVQVAVALDIARLDTGSLPLHQVLERGDQVVPVI
jgi:hypothetical protein